MMGRPDRHPSRETWVRVRPRREMSMPTTSVAMVVATEAVLLRPQAVEVEQFTVGEAGLWPIFVLVVDERPDTRALSACPLLELLTAPKRTDELTFVTGRTQWTIVDPRRALLRMTVRVEAPVRFEADILVPAGRVLDVLDVVAQGATIGITTRRHAAALRGPVDVRAALRDLVLVNSPPPTELGKLTKELCGAGR